MTLESIRTSPAILAEVFQDNGTTFSMECISVSEIEGRRGYEQNFYPDNSYATCSSLPLHRNGPLRQDETERRY
jgi:hypothetical protein